MPLPPTTTRRRAAEVAGVALSSYFPLGMKRINSQFIHVSANVNLNLFLN